MSTYTLLKTLELLLTHSLGDDVVDVDPNVSDVDNDDESEVDGVNSKVVGHKDEG